MEDNKTLEQEIDRLLVNTADDVKELLKDRDKLLKRKPFTRGGKIMPMGKAYKCVTPGSQVSARLPGFRKQVISQDQYMAELDPYMHSVLFDDNIPSICVKTVENGVAEVKFVKSAQPFQEIIMQKQTLHLACLPTTFTLSDKKPTASVQSDFVTFKHFWDLRNLDGMKVKMVATAKSFGDAGLLFYLDRNGQIKARLISYEDGYVICSHNDKNGDRMLETIYYADEDGNEVIDSWDDKAMYRYTYTPDGQVEFIVEPHPFGEIPLVTKRTKVAWDNGQTLIESFERTDNITKVVQNKWGWGFLWVKGRIDPKAQKIAGNIVLNDTSIEGKGDARFLEPPSPKNATEVLDQIFAQIEIATGTTFILPKDIHTSSDTSGIAVQMTKELDINTAKNGCVEWQNVIDKMVRLFKRGLAVELVRKGIKSDAITEYDKMNINASFDIWQPYSINEYNTMLGNMRKQGILSRKTAVEQNTVSRPDEIERIEAEEAEAIQKELDKMEKESEIKSKNASQSTNSNKNE